MLFAWDRHDVFSPAALHSTVSRLQSRKEEGSGGTGCHGPRRPAPTGTWGVCVCRSRAKRRWRASGHEGMAVERVCMSRRLCILPTRVATPTLPTLAPLLAHTHVRHGSWQGPPRPWHLHADCGPRQPGRPLLRAECPGDALGRSPHGVQEDVAARIQTQLLLLWS